MKQLLSKIKILMSKRLALIIIAIVFLVAAGLTAIIITKKGQPKNPGDLITYSTDNPSESKKDADNYNWKGSPEEPKKIKINKINVDAYIQKAGVDQNKKVAVPNNIHLASWFADGQKPGQNGLAIISGHVTGRTSDGVFKKLGSLDKGDEFSIELGNGSIKNYKVIDKVQVKESESANYLFSQNPKVKSQVNLITCGGKFNKSSNQYEDRIIVSGELQ